MKTKIAAIVLAACFAPTVFARLGETRAQCAERYGPPVQTAARCDFYEKAGLSLRVFFDDKDVAVEIYFDNGIDRRRAPGLPSRLYDHQIQALLEANAGSASWKPTAEGWVTSDGKRVAHMEQENRRLVIEDVAFNQESDRLMKEAAKKKLGGF